MAYVLELPPLRELTPLELARNRFRTMSRTVEFNKFKEHQFVLQMGKCFYCRLPFLDSFQVVRKGKVIDRIRYVEVDHIVALSDGGLNDYSNFVLSCQECNLAKQSKNWVNPRG